MNPKQIVFVGQSPNRTAWEHGLELGMSIVSSRTGSEKFMPLRTAEEIAESYCAKVAITGSVGRKLADLADFPLDLRFGGYGRVNLNARWNGKEGKGDKFDRDEAAIAAKALVEFAPGPTRFVLLGAEVARAFEVRGDPLALVERWRETPAPRVKMEFLLFPHPSGINLWWNEEFNRFRARKRLREFLGIEP